MADKYPTVSRNLIYVCIFVGAVLILYYAVRTMSGGYPSPTYYSPGQRVEQKHADDVGTLEKDLKDFEKDPVADDVTELGQATQ